MIICKYSTNNLRCWVCLKGQVYWKYVQQIVRYGENIWHFLKQIKLREVIDRANEVLRVNQDWLNQDLNLSDWFHVPVLYHLRNSMYVFVVILICIKKQILGITDREPFEHLNKLWPGFEPETSVFAYQNSYHTALRWRPSQYINYVILRAQFWF